VVNEALKDQLRRRKNIILSGLPESDVSDAEALRALCEDYLQYKPWFDERQCRRIGKSNPRRLLVTLPSEQQASELITAAQKHLRSVPCPRVFFNPDLTKAEAEQAYLKRKEKTSGLSDN